MALADAVAAVELDALSMTRGVGGEELGHRRLAGDAGGAGVLGPGGAVGEEGGGVDVEGHVGEVALDHLQVGEGGAEELAAGGAGEGLVEGAAGEAEGGGGDGRAEDVEDGHGDLEAVAGLADQG